MRAKPPRDVMFCAHAAHVRCYGVDGALFCRRAALPASASLLCHEAQQRAARKLLRHVAAALMLPAVLPSSSCPPSAARITASFSPTTASEDTRRILRRRAAFRSFEDFLSPLIFSPKHHAISPARCRYASVRARHMIVSPTMPPIFAARPLTRFSTPLILPRLICPFFFRPSPKMFDAAAVFRFFVFPARRPFFAAIRQRYILLGAASSFDS